MKKQFKDNMSRLNSYARYSSIVFQMIAIIGCFSYIGNYIDKIYEIKPQWTTIAMSLISIAISLYWVIKQINTKE